MLITGRTLYGKTEPLVHEGREVAYVKTLFAHLNFFPVSPVQSYLILSGTEKQSGKFTGIPIPHSKASINHAYLRGFLTLALLASAMALLTFGLLEDYANMWAPAIVAVAAIRGFFWSSKKASVVSKERAAELNRYAVAALSRGA